MKPYQIRLSKAAAKGFLKIDRASPSIGHKIRSQVDALKTDPGLGIKLQGADQETRRIRVGDYRIIYEVYANFLLILVVYIGPRGSAYKDY